MRILYFDFDDHRNPLLGAGQGRATWAVGQELVKLGHDVTVVCSKYPGFQDRTEVGIRYIHIGLGTKSIQLNNAAYLIAAPLYARKVTHKQFDICIECSTAPTSTLLTPLFTRVPVVVLPSMFNAREFTKKYKLPFYLVEEWGIKHYRYAMPYSSVDSAKLHALNPSLSLRCIQQGVESHFFEIPHREPKHFLFLSRFDIAQKGIDLLLESYALVKDKTSYPLVIAGHGPDENKVQLLIRRLRLQDKVKMVGSAYGALKHSLLSDAVAVVFPSRHDEMCLWTVEALASGMPHVVFDIPENYWIPAEAAIKVPAFDTAKYAEALLKVTVPAENKRMRLSARAFARDFSWEKVARETARFLAMVIENESKK